MLAWTGAGRTLVFVMAASSIWCLLSEFYGLCSMRTFTLWVLIPATIVLIGMAMLDRVMGDGRLCRAVVIGSIGGALAACSYDVFRLLWVVGAVDHVGPGWMRMQLFKVFPRFGAMILGTPSDQFSGMTDSQFSLTAHLIGWVYHFSNGISFGVMYMALIGDPRRRSWLWAIVLAVGLEIGMLITPYGSFFAIPITALFVVVTITAHTIFGVALGRYARWAGRRGLSTAEVQLA